MTVHIPVWHCQEWACQSKWPLGSAQFNVTSFVCLAQTWNCCITWRNHNIFDAQYCILLHVAGWDFTVSGGVHLYSMSTVYVQEFGQVHLYSMFGQNASNSVHMCVNQKQMAFSFAWEWLTSVAELCTLTEERVKQGYTVETLSSSGWLRGDQCDTVCLAA